MNINKHEMFYKYYCIITFSDSNAAIHINDFI